MDTNDVVMFKCLDVSVAVKLPDLKQVEDLKFWLERFCPAVETDNRNSAGADYLITCKHSDKNNYTITSKQSISLYSTWNYDYGAFLAKFITQVFQKILNSEDFYIFPSACVVKDNKAVLILGDYWQGKTSVALNTFSLDQNVNIISDNYVIIKKRRVLYGTKYISLRKENISRYDKLLDTNKIKEVNSRTFFEYSNKKAPSKIVGCVIPYINQGDDNLHVVSKEESAWYLYQKMSRIINGDTVLFNGMYPSPNFDDKMSAIKRLNYVKRFLLFSDLHYASSNIDRISNYILKIMEN